ncbi:MAG TPA: (S)-benzoin forming benzil reductase [Bacillaceae bacterium]
MNVYIITGASKGIGLALSKKLLGKRNKLICIARSRKEELIKEAEQMEIKLAFITMDLADTSRISGEIEKILSALPEEMESATLINNAGVIEPIGKTEDNDPVSLANSIQVNLTAPMLLSSAFIRMLKDKQITKRIINISSGAGRKSYTGWSSYCAGKAGLDRYSLVVAKEQQKDPFGVKIVSVAPGIIDTGMQEKIRASDERDFEQLNRFIGYKEQGLLSTPEETAAKLCRLMESDTFDSLDTLLDLRDYD